MDENREREQEPEAEQTEQGPPEDEEVELRDEGLDRSASGALRPLGDNPG